MNENELEQSLSEWMYDDQSRASSWVLGSVVAHARQHPNRSWWRHLLKPARLVGATGPGAVPRPGLVRPAFATMAIVAAFIIAVVLVLPGPTPEPDRAPAFVPSSPLADASPSAPTPTSRPDDLSGFDPNGGLVGSLWLRQGNGERDSYVTLHPDGTIVQVAKGPGWPVGIGTWQPTGARSLTSLVAWPDADPVNHLRPGFSTHRDEWALDEDGSAATLTWTARLQPADGSTVPDVSGASTLVRLQRLPLPPEAAYPSPAEPGWELAVGPMVQGSGSGGVAAITAPCDEPDESGTPPGYLVTHGDGTAFLASYWQGNGPGLWVPTGPDTRGLSSWFGLDPAHDLDNWPVAQLAGTGTITVSEGTSEEFLDEYEAETRSIEPMDEPLPAVDPALWPATGSVWLQPTDSGTAITAYLTDGTAVVRDPRYGTGTGHWQPLDPDTIAAWVAFSTLTSHDHLWSEATTGPDGDTLSISYKHQDKSGGPVETGQAEASRLRIEP